MANKRDFNETELAVLLTGAIAVAMYANPNTKAPDLDHVPARALQAAQELLILVRVTYAKPEKPAKKEVSQPQTGRGASS